METKRVIPPSELIINDDGSAFHIHLRPEQLRDKILLVGDPGRADMIADTFFDSIDYRVASREFHAIGGTYKGKPLMVISHGIGSDNMEIVVTELDALANIDFETRTVKPQHRTLEMVRVGTSGALPDDLRIGDAVLAELATGTDGILNYYAGRDAVCDLDFQREFMAHTDWNSTWATPYTVAADPELTQRIGGNDMRRGSTIAAVGFYAPQGRSVRLPLADPTLISKIESFRYKGKPVTNFEMESAVMQGLARMLGHKAVTACCIIAQRVAQDADTDYKPAVMRLVETVLDRI